MASHPIIDVLNSKFNGKISKGSHSESDNKACVLEVVSVAKGVSFTDNPTLLGMPDFRAINDAFIDDEKRTISLVRLGVEFWDYSEWNLNRKVKFAELLAIGTVKRLLPIALRAAGLETQAVACEAATTLAEAQIAASNARLAASDAARYASDAAGYASNAARLASYVARYVGYADSYAASYVARYVGYADSYAASYARLVASDAASAGDAILIDAVNLWIECSQKSAEV